jgi:hypothetical protein
MSVERSALDEGRLSDATLADVPLAVAVPFALDIARWRVRLRACFSSAGAGFSMAARPRGECLPVGAW